jgi:predicted nuclease of predicted toxin-antitoxin system
VAEFGLQRSDEAIWTFAIENDFVIVTKDDDFEHKALLLAPPGKVILVTLGNCATDAVARLLLDQRDLIEVFTDSRTETLLVLP